MTDISVILTAHREGVIAGATVHSALEAIDYAREICGVSVEIIAVLDRTNSATETVLKGGLGKNVRVLHVDEGDPGQTRNRGIEVASGTCSTFLDGDDLWSFNWLAEAWKMIEERPDAVAHSACNVVFGQERNLWWHIDSEGPLFAPGYLVWANYWDAMSFARTDIYRRFPFKKNDLKLGFGHEDWHWNCMTIDAGVPHKPVAETVHFKRRRAGSQMAQVAKSDSVVWPLVLR